MAVVACFYMWWWHSSMIVYFRILGSRSRSDDWIRASSHSSSASIRCHVNHPWSESFKARTSCAPRPGRILLSPAGKGWAFVRSIWKSGENETSGLLGHQRSPSRWVQQIKVCAGQTHIFYPLWFWADYRTRHHNTARLKYLGHWKWEIWGKFCSHIPLNNHSRKEGKSWWKS